MMNLATRLLRNGFLGKRVKSILTSPWIPYMADAINRKFTVWTGCEDAWAEFISRLEDNRPKACDANVAPYHYTAEIQHNRLMIREGGIGLLSFGVDSHHEEQLKHLKSVFEALPASGQVAIVGGLISGERYVSPVSKEVVREWLSWLFTMYPELDVRLNNLQTDHILERPGLLRLLLGDKDDLMLGCWYIRRRDDIIMAYRAFGIQWRVDQKRDVTPLQVNDAVFAEHLVEVAENWKQRDFHTSEAIAYWTSECNLLGCRYIVTIKGDMVKKL